MFAQMMTADQVAKWLGLSQSTVYRLAATEQIPSVRVGGSLRFDQDRVARWLADEETQP